MKATAEQQSGKAIGLLLLGVMGGLGLDLCAKQLLESYSLEQFILIRSLIGAALFVLIAMRFGGLKQLATRRLHWHLLRTLLSCGAMFGFFYALTQMPLIDALTLGYTAPLMVTALSALMLGDPVGWRRWSAVLTGFLGVLVMLRPGSGEWTVASGAVLFAAFCYAALAISARKLADTESSTALSLYVIAGPALISGLMLWKSGWEAPDTTGWTLFIAAGICSVIAWLGIVGGYRRASPAMLAPIEYSALVMGAAAGFLIWGEIPDRYTVAGGLVIVASGLFVAYRELSHPMTVRNLRALTATALVAARRWRANSRQQ